jgi:hypothetical protein
VGPSTGILFIGIAAVSFGPVKPPGGGERGLASGVVQSFRVEVPAGTAQLAVRMTPANLNADAELLVRFAARPTEQLHDCEVLLLGGVDVCTFNRPAAGTYYVSLAGFDDFTGITLLATEQ